MTQYTTMNKLTKNRLYNLIMQEVDKITAQSNNTDEMQFKLSALPANVAKAVERIR